MDIAEESIANISSVREDVNHNVLSVDKIELPQKSMDIGVLHNHVLQAIIDDKDQVRTSKPDISELELSILHSVDFEDEVTSCIRNYETTGVNITDGSLQNKVILLYQRVFNSCTDSYDDIVSCINTYHMLIEESDELTEDEKQNIYTGLAVSLYSLNYWKDYGEFPQN